ncbi:AAA family ATPase [Vibrio ostreae]|uniref:AAA family ATPase n=1 Tax=Vibrio ostreae TaxID=2841925 RepID=UPI0021158E94|nr:AAA family ATPase [Vibrio ostreae]
MKKPLQVVVTGGPGGGKTTALDLFRRELGKQIVVVPEAATLLFSGGVTRCNNEQAIKMVQKTIFQLQRNLEDIHKLQYPDRLLVCDRGSLDGLAYWPNSESDFFKQVNSTFEKEIARYDAVIFLSQPRLRVKTSAAIIQPVMNLWLRRPSWIKSYSVSGHAIHTFILSAAPNPLSEKSCSAL